MKILKEIINSKGTYLVIIRSVTGDFLFNFIENNRNHVFLITKKEMVKFLGCCGGCLVNE